MKAIIGGTTELERFGELHRPKLRDDDEQEVLFLQLAYLTINALTVGALGSMLGLAWQCLAGTSHFFLSCISALYALSGVIVCGCCVKEFVSVAMSRMQATTRVQAAAKLAKTRQPKSATERAPEGELATV